MPGDRTAGSGQRLLHHVEAARDVHAGGLVDAHGVGDVLRVHVEAHDGLAALRSVANAASSSARPTSAAAPRLAHGEVADLGAMLAVDRDDVAGELVAVPGKPPQRGVGVAGLEMVQAPLLVARASYR